MKKKALITGITGQDGAYLAELLLSKDYEVHGLRRRVSIENLDRVGHLQSAPHRTNSDFFLHYGDMTDSSSLLRIIKQVEPDEIYNLAAQSHVHVSFDSPEYTANADAIGTLRILESIRILGFTEKTKYYQASTSELYGKIQEPIQNETTPFHPRSPYAAAKLYAYWITVNYREAYGIFACNGILFNHESPVRGETFVTRKITKGLSGILFGRQKDLCLGNLDAKRDWGHAKDYVRMQWMMLQHDTPEDFVIATGVNCSVRQFLEIALDYVGISISWQGSGVNEIGIIGSIDKNRYSERLGNDVKLLPVGYEMIKIDPFYYRPTEVDCLLGDSTKAKETLGWEPQISLDELIEEMMAEDIYLANRNLTLSTSGERVIRSSE